MLCFGFVGLADWACFVFSQPAYIIPQNSSIVKFLGRGSVVQILKVLREDCGVLKVVGIGLQLFSVMVLKPQVVACDVAEHFVPPTVAIAHDGVLAVVGVELVCSHDLPFVVCNICYVFGVLAGLFLFFPTSLYYTTKLWDCQIFRATGVTEVRYEIGGMLWVLGDNVTKNITQKSQ